MTGKLSFASFFSGIGGFEYGFELAGMEVKWQCEINPFRQKVLNKNFPHVPLFGDINNVEASDIPAVDLWCGGFPCQDLSLANQGKRKGLKGDRSGLFFAFYGLLKKRKPRWIVLENVPGLLNSHNGKDFQILLKALDECGYGLAWRVLDAQYFGTPQRRRRVFIVGSFGSMRSARVLFEPETNNFVTKAGMGAQQQLGTRVRGRARKAAYYAIQHAGINRKVTAGPQAKGYRNDGKTYTLDSRGSSDAVCSTDVGFGVRETARFAGEMDSNRYRAIGDAVCSKVSVWLGSRIVHCDKYRK